jgi:benzoylformate decarboxylase
VRNGAATAAEFVRTHAARYVFGLPGSSSVPLFNQLAQTNTDFVAAVHENSAVALADGYARFAGLTAVLLYMVPGAATGSPNLYNAHRDETPLLTIVSQLHTRARMGARAVGEGDISQLLGQMSRHVHEVRHRDQLVEALSSAVRFANGPPSGPAVVVVPEDVWTATADDGPSPVANPTPATVSGTDLEPLIKGLLEAEAPLIVVGGQVRRTGGTEELERLSSDFAVPVLYEPFWNDRLGIAPGHPCCLGQLGERSRIAQSADFVLLLGCRFFNEVHPKPGLRFPRAYVAHINEDPQKVASGRAAHWSAAVTPGRLIGELARTLQDRRLPPAEHRRRTDRLLAEQARRRQRARKPSQDLADAIGPAMDYSIVVDESVTANAAILASLNSSDGSRYVSTTGGSLGWGTGAAAGVVLATDLPVTCILGDGAFFFGLQGLIPSVTLDLPVTYVVIDNGGYASTQYFEHLYTKEQDSGASEQQRFNLGSDFRGQRPDIGKLASAFGLEVHTVDTPEALAGELRKARTGQHLIRIETEPAW